MNFINDNILKGSSVYLRHLERTDLDRTWEWLHRADIHERVGVMVPFSRTKQEAWFASLEQAQDKNVFAVCRIEDDVHIGNASLDMIDLRHRNAGLSIFVADQEIRGKGHGSDALRVLARYAFDYLNLHRIWCKTDADDTRLEYFYTRLGFQAEGVLREHEFRNGVFIDKKLFARIR